MCYTGRASEVFKKQTLFSVHTRKFEGNIISHYLKVNIIHNVELQKSEIHETFSPLIILILHDKAHYS